MEDTLLMDAVERLYRGEMSAEEKEYFEEMRKKNPELDQKVVEHLFFLNEMDTYSAAKKFKNTLHEVELKLTEEGLVKKSTQTVNGKIVYLWNRYKRTMAVAASIAGIVSLCIGGIVSVVNSKKDNNITQLVKTINDQENKTRQIESKLNILAAHSTQAKQRFASTFMATGFMIDSKNNYIATNAHVVSQAKKQLIVENNNGEQYTAKAVYINHQTDLAIIQILDTNFKSLPALPYRIENKTAELGDQVFMLGYPKQEIVYGEGYVAAQNGYNLDTIYCQLSTAAMAGNSGSPVLSGNGDLVGIISSTQTNAQDIVYAIKPSNIFTAIQEVEKIPEHEHIHINDAPSLRGLKRTTQIKKLRDYVFMIKGN